MGMRHVRMHNLCMAFPSNENEKKKNHFLLFFIVVSVFVYGKKCEKTELKYKQGI